MIYGSICSGIEAASVAWHPLGWRAAFLSEIEAFPKAVLQHHYPSVPLHGDFTTIQADDYEPIDLLVGGTPCQDFSIAGLRAGMAGDRGNLTLQYLALAGRLRPRWLVWENVPGVLSSNGGRDFGAFLGELGKLGYGWAYRTLDAQYFGVPQRRRRVFVVGYLGDWRVAAAVLFERQSLSRDSAPSRKARKDVAPTISARTRGGGGLGPDFDLDGSLVAKCLSVSHTASGRYDPSVETYVTGTLQASGKAAGSATQQDAESVLLITQIAPALTSNPYGDHESREGLLVTHPLRAYGFDASEDGTGRGTPLIPVTYSIMPQNSGKDYKAREVEVAQPLMAGGPVGGNQGGDYVVQPTPFDTTQITSKANGSRPKAGDCCHPLASGAHAPAIAYRTAGDGAVYEEGDSTAPLTTGSDPSANIAVFSSKVRRLVPIECERLQGLPDNYTRIPIRCLKSKPRTKHFSTYPDHYEENGDGTWTKFAADGPRYHALGNSMARPVMEWIGRRIQLVETFIRSQSEAAE